MTWIKAVTTARTKIVAARNEHEEAHIQLIVHLDDDMPQMLDDTREQYERDARVHAEQYLSVIGHEAREAGVEWHTEHVTHDQPYEAIVAAARERKGDLIMMASHGRSGMQGLLLGSVTRKVPTHSAVLVCR